VSPRQNSRQRKRAIKEGDDNDADFATSDVAGSDFMDAYKNMCQRFFKLVSSELDCPEFFDPTTTGGGAMKEIARKQQELSALETKSAKLREQITRLETIDLEREYVDLRGFIHDQCTQSHVLPMMVNSNETKHLIDIIRTYLGNHNNAGLKKRKVAATEHDEKKDDVDDEKKHDADDDDDDDDGEKKEVVVDDDSTDDIENDAGDRDDEEPTRDSDGVAPKKKKLKSHV
jgi:hypothetical protein